MASVAVHSEAVALFCSVCVDSLFSDASVVFGFVLF